MILMPKIYRFKMASRLIPLWEQNSVRPLIYGLYWELFLPVLYTIIYQECFL